MAFIVRDGAQKELTSPLSYAPLDRAIDCLKLAQMGHGESRRLWNDFARESPGTARVVAKSVAQDNAKITEATKQADTVLTRGEFITKGASGCAPRPKVTKRRKTPSVAEVSRVIMLTKTAGAGKVVRTRQEALRAMVEADLRSPDPERRTTAAEILAAGLV